MEENVVLGFKGFAKAAKEQMPLITIKQTDKHFVIKIPKVKGSQSGVKDGHPIALGLYNIVVIDGKMMIVPPEEKL